MKYSAQTQWFRVAIPAALLVAWGWGTTNRANAQSNVPSPTQREVEAQSAKTWVGKKVESFALPDINGKTVDIAATLGKRPVVLVFYRGNWCPFCHKQLRELGKAESDFKAANAVVYAISDEDAPAQKEMKTKEKLGDTFVFLSDKDGKAAAHYAGRYEGKTTLKPATFVIGKDGKIQYAYVGEDYKERASVQAVLTAVKQAKSR